MIRFACPVCYKIYKSPEALAGKKTICKKCKCVVLIPAGPAPEAVPGVSIVAPTPSSLLPASQGATVDEMNESASEDSGDPLVRRRRQRRMKSLKTIAGLVGISSLVVVTGILLFPSLRDRHRDPSPEASASNGRGETPNKPGVPESHPGLGANVQTLIPQSTLGYGHTMPASVLSFSPNGRLLASAGLDGTIRVWDLKNGSNLISVAGTAKRLTFSPDGRLLASTGGFDGIKLWDITTGKNVANLNALPLPGEGQDVCSMSFSSDGKTLAAGMDRSVRIWDVASRTNTFTLDGTQSGLINAIVVALSSDGKRVVAGSFSGRVILWDAVTGKERLSLRQADDGPVEGVAIDADGSHFATIGRCLTLWDAESGKSHVLRAPELVSTLSVLSVQFGADGKTLSTLAVGSGFLRTEERPIEISAWDTIALKPISTSSVKIGLGYGIAMSPDGKAVASGDTDSRIRVWDVKTGSTLQTFGEGHTSTVSALVFGSDSRTLVSGGNDGSIFSWNPETGQMVAQLQKPLRPQVESIAIGSNGKDIAWTFGSKIVLGDLPTGKVRNTIDGDAQTLAFGEDSRILAASNRSSIELIDTRSGTKTRLGSLFLTEIRAMAFDETRTRIVTVGKNGQINNCSLATGKCTTVPGEWSEKPLQASSPLFSIVISHDSKTVVTLGFPMRGETREPTVDIWDTTSGRKLATWKAEQGTEAIRALSPRGDLVATTGLGGTLRLVEARTGVPIVTLARRAQPTLDIPQTVAFSPDGHFIAAGSEGVITLWSLRGLPNK